MTLRAEPEYGQADVNTAANSGDLVTNPAAGAEPAWTKLRRDYKAIAKGILAHSKSNRVSVVAGSLSYRWFLSLFPAIVGVVAGASLVRLPHGTVRRLVHGASVALPAGAANVVTGALEHANHHTGGALGTTVAAAAVALFSASSAMTVLQSGLDMAYEIRGDRKFLSKRLVAGSMLAGIVALGGAASALVVFGPAIGHAISGAVPIGARVFAFAWTAARWVAAILLVLTLFAFIYWIGPNHSTPWRWLSPGAVVGTVLWVAASLGFSFYTTTVGSYAKTYGALAGVVVLVFWLYITGLVVLLGAEVNAEIARRP